MTYSEKLKDPRWQRKRLAILERDGWACVFCGATESTLHVHHMEYHENPWDTPDELLETLCDTHHTDREEMKKWIRTAAYRMPSARAIPLYLAMDEFSRLFPGEPMSTLWTEALWEEIERRGNTPSPDFKEPVRAVVADETAKMMFDKMREMLK